MGRKEGKEGVGLRKREEKEKLSALSTKSQYIVPTSADLPMMETELIDNLFAYGASGAKGCGELTFVGGAPALGHAIEMAIKRKIYKIPANPEYLMEVVENGKD